MSKIQNNEKLKTKQLLQSYVHIPKYGLCNF